MGLPPTQTRKRAIGAFEVTPYAWLNGIDGDISVGDNTASIDASFTDLIDKVDFASSVLLDAVYQDTWVAVSQIDYFELSEKFSRRFVSGRIKSKMFLASVAGGRRFQGGLTANATTDLLFGVRYSGFDNTVHVDKKGSVNGTSDIIDGFVGVRSSIPFCERWSFDSRASIGTGDSDLTYELEPMLGYAFNERWTGRFGYRRLHYDYKSGDAEFDGALHGFIVGAGYSF